MDNPGIASNSKKHDKDILISYFERVTDQLSFEIGINQVLELIRTGKGFKKTIQSLRKETIKAKADAIKKKLPSVTFSGLFNGERNAESLLRYSEMICIDLDNVKELSKVKAALSNDPVVYAFFISPSGNGLKILVKVSCNSDQHKDAFECLQSYFLRNHNLQVDKKCQDVTRLCFLTYDPEIYINDNSEIFQITASNKTTSIPIDHNSILPRLSHDVEIVVKRIEELRLDITSGYDNWLKLAFAFAQTLGELGRTYFHRISIFSPQYDVKETDKQYSACLKSAKKGITINSFFYIAKKFGIRINSNVQIEIENAGNEHFSNLHEGHGKNIVFYIPSLDKNQNIVDIKINYTKFNELLLSFGFQRFDVENDFIMVKIEKNIIEEVKPNFIQDTFFNYLEGLPDALSNGISKEMLIEKFNKSPETYFSKKRYSLLRPIKEYKFVCDTKDKCYVFYRNGFVECTKDGWQLKDYRDLNGFIWKNQLHDREFNYLAIDVNLIYKLGVFAKFIFNITGKNQERFKSLCTIIGYNLHTYFEGKLKATILTDSRISDLPDGRTGKSLLSNGLSKIKKVCNIKGKDFDTADKFKYQEADLDNQIITIDDARKNLDFEMMFNDITEGIKVNKKNLKPFTIRAKILITTNRTLRIEGASAKDRSIEFELADHYTEKFSPQDEFKKWFFGNDFLKEDWHLFDNFMMSCICLYLKNGILKVSSINLNRRKLIETTNNEFVEFMDSKVESGLVKPEEEYLKQELHNQFLNEYAEYKEDKYLSKLKNFTLFLRLFAKYTSGFAEVRKEDERKSNDKRYIRFRSEKEGL